MYLLIGIINWSFLLHSFNIILLSGSNFFWEGLQFKLSTKCPQSVDHVLEAMHIAMIDIMKRNWIVGPSENALNEKQRSVEIECKFKYEKKRID